jgi:hypothetical protein
MCSTVKKVINLARSFMKPQTFSKETQRKILADLHSYVACHFSPFVLSSMSRLGFMSCLGFMSLFGLHVVF